MATDLDRLAYSPAEVASMLGVTRATVDRWIAEGRLRAVRVGGVRVPGRPGRPPGRVLVPAEAVRELLGAQ